MFSQATAQVVAAQADLLARQRESSDQLRVRAVEDDPTAAILAQGVSDQGRRLEAMRLSEQLLRGRYEESQQGIEEALDIMRRARLAAVGGRNAVLNPDNLQQWRVEVDTLTLQLLAVANTQARGRYIFAGSLDNLPPFDAAGVYTGNAQVALIEVAPGAQLPLNVPGDALFAPAGGTNAINALITLSAAMSALNASLAAGAPSPADFDDVGAGIDRIDAASSVLRRQLTTLRSTVQRLDAVSDRRRRAGDQLIAAGHDLVEVDQVRSATALRLSDVKLQATSQAASLLFSALNRF